MASDRIVLTVPARNEFAKTARMTVSELASRIGMSYDDVDDVRMAAEEAFIYAVTRCGGADVTFRVEVADHGLVIEVGPLPCADSVVADDEAQERYASFILESVCDEFEIQRDVDGTTLRLVKRMGDGRA